MPNILIKQKICSAYLAHKNMYGNLAPVTAWNEILEERKMLGRWNDPILRPAENYYYSYVAVKEHGDSPTGIAAGVRFHAAHKYIPGLSTSPPSRTAYEWGIRGVEDAKNNRSLDEICDVQRCGKCQ